jgi:hypothetical protein
MSEQPQHPRAANPYYRGYSIEQEPDGSRHVVRVEPMCDFCLGRPVKWGFPVQKVTLRIDTGVSGVTDDDWAACDPCKQNIEAQNWAAVLRRSIKVQMSYLAEEHDIPVTNVIIPAGDKRRIERLIKDRWAQFREVRDGPPYPAAEHRQMGGKRG